MEKSIIESAKKCLNCKAPQCKESCPINTPIPEMIKLFLNGEIKEAGEMLFKNNPLSIICSLVCPHENQCEGHCIMGIKNSPIEISSIEHYISNYYLNIMDLKPGKRNNHSVGIIGAGPAGITIAFLLALKGYKITIFEGHDKIGGVLRYGIPEFRLPKSILDRLHDKLIEIGVKIRPNTMIGKNLTIDELFRDGYEAIFIGTGVWNPKKLGIKGESLGNVHFAIDYLKAPEVYDLGEKVCVIGAGNVAMDVARTALRKGSKEVYLMYRKGIEDMSAGKHEIKFAKIDGVKFELFKNPVELTNEGVKYIKTKKIIENGNEKLIYVEGSEKIFKCDSIIVAVSQNPRDLIVSNTNGIDVNNRGLVITDDYGRTTRDGVFASGDVVTGAKTVVEAVRVSKKVVCAIEEYIKE